MDSPRTWTASPRTDCDSLSHVLYDGGGFSISREQCLRQALRRSDEEQQPHHVMIFPVSGVNVLQVGDDSFVVDPAHVTLSNGGDVYRVDHPMGSGEVTIQLVIEEDPLLAALESHDPRLPVSRDHPFPRGQVKRSPQLHLELLQLIGICDTAITDATQVEESVLGLVDSVAAELAALERMPRRAATACERELADAAATLLAGRYTAPLSLGDIAEALGVTKFRLCRVFKRVTGETLWQRVQQLRVRHAVVELAEGAGDLADLALGLGFSSHSHFTASFRRVFGTTPSAVRRSQRRRLTPSSRAAHLV